MIRVGQGFDVHRHTDDESRPLVLGGCHFDGERGLDGHSDADVPAHAAADALLGAAGLGDLGKHFPDTDPQWSGADSLMILSATADMVRQAGWKIGNVDVKVAHYKGKVVNATPEFEQVKKIAIETGLPLKDVQTEVLNAFNVNAFSSNA